MYVYVLKRIYELQWRANLYENDINMIRKAILKQSASLISHIDKLLKSSSGVNSIDHTDGPSTPVDDFSSADAIRNVSEDIPWHLWCPIIILKKNTHTVP